MRTPKNPTPSGTGPSPQKGKKTGSIQWIAAAVMHWPTRNYIPPCVHGLFWCRLMAGPRFCGDIHSLILDVLVVGLEPSIIVCSKGGRCRTRTCLRTPSRAHNSLDSSQHCFALVTSWTCLSTPASLHLQVMLFLDYLEMWVWKCSCMLATPSDTPRWPWDVSMDICNKKNKFQRKSEIF
jgi:hypothetical protein